MRISNFTILSWAKLYQDLLCARSVVVSAGNAKINKIAHTPPSRTISLFSLGVYSVWLPGLSQCCYFPSAGVCCSAGKCFVLFVCFSQVCLPSPSPPFSTAFLSLKMRQSFLSVRPHQVKSLTTILCCLTPLDVFISSPLNYTQTLSLPGPCYHMDCVIPYKL